MADTSSRIMPVGSNVSNHNFPALDNNSYTAHRLKHASPEHLHLTTRRFFIGPIPEGWLNSNRKSWYRRRVELSSYSSKKSSFNAAANSGPHHRTMTGLDEPSTTARMSFSFPQPEDVGDEMYGSDNAQEATADEDEEEEQEELDDEIAAETRMIEPVATHELQNGTPRDSTEHSRNQSGRQSSETERQNRQSTLPVLIATRPRPSRSPARESFVTAREQADSVTKGEASTGQVDRQDNIHRTLTQSDGQRFSTSNPDLRLNHERGFAENPETSSREPLLPQVGGSTSLQSPQSPKSIKHHAPAPIENDHEIAKPLGRTRTGVRFKVSEGVENRKHRVSNKVGHARERVGRKRSHRDTLQAGTIVKMEKMLVRIEVTVQPVPEDFDENASLKIETKVMEKWREFMVVTRKSRKQDSEDFRLQMYNTRVIPEIDDENTKKRPAREIRLDPKTTHVNLYSSLDKSVVIWHPYRKGTRIVILRPSSTSHSVEWYTFLRDSMGWKRPLTLEVSVPDLDVSLRLERPFEGLEAAGLHAKDDEEALQQTAAAEQAVAGRIVSQCIDMLEGDPEWTSVLKTWNETAKMGLAWKRYDRLEWVHGATEKKMYGSMAMQHSHDLELRPKHHSPTTTHGKQGTRQEEPPPVEGFLIRLTSQKGVHQRMGKAFFKRLYFYTQDQFLMFNRPAKATPPHPPRLATIGGTNIPSAQEIVEKTPMTFDVEPFRLRDGKIAWLESSNSEDILRNDLEAFEEARRNVANISESDGYINLTQISKVRTFNWGAAPGDEGLEQGSGDDVDFHQDVPNTTLEDGSTKEVDEDRVFELVLENGLIVRLQAYSVKARNEWMQRLRKLVKYWKLRTAADTDTFKSVRRTNLDELKIDEEMEAILGQFGRKWEVSRSVASPELFNMCGISSCRPVTLSGLLYRKVRRRSTFQRCGVILSGGKLLIYQAALRKVTGEQVRYIHQDKQDVVDLKDCYVYSGLLVEDDLLYQNRTFDSNHPGLSSLPRVYLDDGWTSADVDVMTCFVVWMNQRKGWFRTAGQAATTATGAAQKTNGARARLTRVRQLGVPGRGMVFKCRSRAERDHWVLSVASEIERLVEAETVEHGGQHEVRLDR